ncbi:MAG: efflux RND transporter periplasmic adaptor subunit [Desulfobulbaceae bacterium]|nr:efflux RND transporter periplasmic adaptor subunit [Desulfobulbaceae bacterium]
MSKNNQIITALICLLIIAGGFGTLRWFISTRKAPIKAERSYLGPLVEVLPATLEDRQIIIHATGTVEPSEEITVIPRVSGQVTSIHPQLKSGGFIKKGEILFTLEDADYQAALEHAKAAAARAELELANTRSRAEVARLEWERVKTANSPEPDPLLLFIPQLNNSRAALESAKAAVATAELNIERTRIKAPFDALVRWEKVDPGQFVSPGMASAALAATRQVEIKTPLRLEDLPFLELPEPGKKENGSPARLELRAGELTHHWEGRVTRMLGEVDPKNRMTSVIITVNDPYGLTSPENARHPLSLGLFVDIYLDGKTLKEVFAVPRNCVRDDSTVWIMDQEGKLRIRTVEIVRYNHDTALISKGLVPGELIIKTTLSGVSDGMKIRAAQGEKKI